MTDTIVIDRYVCGVLMRDLVGHDRAPSAFLVYLHLWGTAVNGVIQTSHQEMAEATGLSRSAVQKGVRRLVERKLLRVRRETPTSVPRYRVLRTWRRPVR